MNKLLVLAATALLFTFAHAHLTQICSSTNPAKAGEIDFFFGTYHNYQTKTPPGTVTISQPTVSGGAKLSGTFNSKFKVSGSGSNPKFVITTPAATKAELIKITGGIVTDKCQVDCYVTNTASAKLGKTPDGKGQWIVPNPQTSKADMTCRTSGSFTWTRFFSKLTVKGAKSGNWLLEVKGTDQVYDPDAKQCSLSKTNPKWIGGMTVADGTPSCSGKPTVPASIDAASVAGCNNLIGGGECNGFKCAAGMKDGVVKGHIKCKGGKYDVTATCQGKSKCAQEANDEIATLTSSIGACQTSVDGMSNGAHCIDKMKKDVAAAQTAADTAAADALTKGNALTKAKGASVTFQPIPLDQISTNCAALLSKLKANSNHGTAKAAWTAADKAATQAEATKKATANSLATAKASQKKEILKCQCNAQNKYDAVYDKCTMNAKAESISWTKAHHLKCVENGAVTLSNHQSSGKCTVPAVPTVKPKKMAFKYVEKDCMAVGMEEEMEDEVAMAEMEDEGLDQVEMVEPKMPGWHKMPNGEMMRDADMN